MYVINLFYLNKFYGADCLAYVWSLDLIPMFARLNQTIEGLFKIASSSLSYATLLHDSYVQNIKALKRRRDVVFSQAVSNALCSYLR